MADNAVPTLAPKDRPQEVPKPPQTQAPVTPLNTDKQALFDSIAQENTQTEEETQSSSLKTFLAGLLWFGYAIAIVVAVILVWEAAGGLLKSSH